MRNLRIVVEAEGDDVGQLYRQLRHIAELIARGETEGVVNEGLDGEREFHLYDLRETT